MAALNRFDGLAETYEGWFATRLGVFVGRRETDLMLALLAARPDEAILEVGSGTGWFLREVARSRARCVGVEPSGEMLCQATSRPLGNVSYVRGCAESLPFKDGAFDGLLCMTTLEFVQDVEAAIREAARVVHPGGRLVFGVLNGDGGWARARRREGGLWAEARFFRTAELAALLSPLGTVRIEHGVHLPPGLAGLPTALLGPVDRLLRCMFPASGALIGARVTRRRQP